MHLRNGKVSGIYSMQDNPNKIGIFWTMASDTMAHGRVRMEECITGQLHQQSNARDDQLK